MYRIFLIILVYILSVIIWLYVTYVMEKPSTVGELLDESPPLTFIPMLNTIFLPIALIIALNIYLYKYILSEFIEKIRKIKL